MITLSVITLTGFHCNCESELTQTDTFLFNCFLWIFSLFIFHICTKIWRQKEKKICPIFRLRRKTTWIICGEKKNIKKKKKFEEKKTFLSTLQCKRDTWTCEIKWTEKKSQKQKKVQKQKHKQKNVQKRKVRNRKRDRNTNSKRYRREKSETETGKGTEKKSQKLKQKQKKLSYASTVKYKDKKNKRKQRNEEIFQ